MGSLGEEERLAGKNTIPMAMPIRVVENYSFSLETLRKNGLFELIGKSVLLLIIRLSKLAGEDPIRGIVLYFLKMVIIDGNRDVPSAAWK